MNRLSLLFLAALVLASGATAQQRDVFEGSTTVVAVEVPTNVVRDGEPVRGLGPESFELRVDGRPEPLTGFEVIDLQATGTGGGEDDDLEMIPLNARRHFLLLFDLSFTRPHSLAKASRSARQLLEKLDPSDLVAVGAYGTSSGARLLLSFTPDRRQAVRVLDVFDKFLDRDLPKARSEKSEDDPLRLVAPLSGVFADLGRLAGPELTNAGATLSDGLAMGSQRGGGPAETLAAMNEMEGKLLVERQRSEVADLTANLGELARLTKGIDGRKFLVYFSEGFDASILEGRGASRILKALEVMIDQFRRAGWTIQSVDAAGVRGVSDGFHGSEGLRRMARETGGELYERFNDLGEAMGSLLERTGVTYLLSFQSGEIPLNGSFHRIEVRLKDAPQGARALHRPGFYAPGGAEERSSFETGLQTSELLLAGEDGGALDVSTLVTPFKTASAERTALGVWVEAEGESLLAERGEAQTLTTDLFVYAMDRGGEIQDFFHQRLDVPIAVNLERLEQGALKFYGDLFLAPGRYDLRLLLRENGSGRYAVRSVPVEVRPFEPSEVALLDPILFDDPGRHSIVVREESSKSERSPFFQPDGQVFYPAVRDQHSADRPLRICQVAYNLSGDVMELRAAVVGSDGSRVEEKRLRIAGKNASDDGTEQLFFDFSPEGLEPGEYTFLLALVDPRSSAMYTSSRSFQLVR